MISKMQIKSYKQTSKLEEIDEKKATKTDFFFRWLKMNGFRNTHDCQGYYFNCFFFILF